MLGRSLSSERLGGPAWPREVGESFRPAWAQDSLLCPPGCLLAFLLALGRGHTYPGLRHKTGQRLRSWLLLHCGPLPDPVPPDVRATAAGTWAEPSL